MDAKDAENDEECATDENDVADGLEGGEQGLHHQFQPRGPVDHPEKSEFGNPYFLYKIVIW